MDANPAPATMIRRNSANAQPPGIHVLTGATPETEPIAGAYTRC